MKTVDLPSLHEHGFACTYLSIRKSLFSFPPLLAENCQCRMSYGTGRPAVLKDDESIWKCRLLLNHPLAIEDDMRLVSTVELMTIRERINNKLGSLDRPVDDQTFGVLQQADEDFREWYKSWDAVFAQKYESAGTAVMLAFSAKRHHFSHTFQLFIDKVCRFSITTLNCFTTLPR
jgi:hypothetical protein